MPKTELMSSEHWSANSVIRSLCQWMGPEGQSRSSGYNSSGISQTCIALGEECKDHSLYQLWPRTQVKRVDLQEKSFFCCIDSFSIPKHRLITLSLRIVSFFYTTTISLTILKLFLIFFLTNAPWDGAYTVNIPCIQVSFKFSLRFLSSNLNTSLHFIFVLIGIWESFLKLSIIAFLWHFWSFYEPNITL